jgi:hypothetical protein
MFARTVPPFLLFLCAVSIAADGYGQSRNIGTSLDPVIRPYLARYDLPALAAAVVKDGKIVASGAVGTRFPNSHLP